MIRLDSRIGSGELEKLFVPYGVKVMKTKLEFGDMDFIGSGPKGASAVVIERKRILDLVQSMESHRLSGHQLPGMIEQYDYRYLIVEGIWKQGPDGELQTRNGHWESQGVLYRAVDTYVASLALRGGVICWRTQDRYETVAYAVDLYRMWQKAWAEHRAHEAVYAPVQRRGLYGHRPSALERMVMQLPGVDMRAREIVAHFKTMDRMVEANERAWCEIEGIGKARARKIMDALRGMD